MYFRRPPRSFHFSSVLLNVYYFPHFFQCNSFDAAIENLCECVLEKLDGLFAHSDANVLITTFTACQRLLQSQKAISFLEKHPLLNVFKTVSNNDLPLIPTQRQLELSKWFDDRNFISTHSNWVKNLVIELFTWFECEYLAALAALQVKSKNFCEQPRKNCLLI